MITTVNGSDKNWSWTDGDTLFYEDGESRPLRTSDVIFVAGKYDGSLLSEVDNTWYLKFLMDKNREDYFISIMFGRRLKEIG